MTTFRTPIRELAEQLEVGDVILIRIPIPPFQMIATTTQSWTNHVGIVTDLSVDEPVIAESRFPLSGSTNLSRFIARSTAGRVAVSRLNTVITESQRARVISAVHRRTGILYDTGFDLHSRRQFCSRFVREVLVEATGIQLGETENFSTLLARNPDADLGFWRLWYFGRIPWRRETVTPASLLRSPNVHIIFDGYVNRDARSI
jgi:hypothetical protein